MSSEPPRVVFDCNVFIQALAFDGPAAACLRLVESNTATLYISRAIMAELRRVLAYTDVRAISPRLTPVNIEAFLQRIRYRAVRVAKVSQVYRYPRDPDDEPYLNLSIAAGAHYLVSRDKDLLALRRGHDLSSKDFRRRAPTLGIVTPTDFLQKVKSER